jgi:hydrogenase maturation protease
MPRTLIIGYGNLDRADDGAAYYVINALRQRLGHTPLDEDSTGLEGLGGETDSVFLMQLVPELMDSGAHYDQVIFVDAHVRADVCELHCEPVMPEYSSSPFTHHMTPSTFLVMLKLLYDATPTGYIVSLRGHDFDFHRGLSAATEELVGPAVEHILQLLRCME